MSAGHDSTKRRVRGKSAKSLELVSASIEILNEIQPASVRAVCYQLFIRGLIPDMSKGSTNRVSTQLVWARENGRIPWHHIVDETRSVERNAMWNNPLERMQQAIRNYRKNYWQEQPDHIEVWSEKGTVRGTLAPVLQQYGLPFRVMHGYGSATALNDVADDSIQTEKRFIVLYVGDWDPSGLHMSEIDMPSRITRYGGTVGLIRVALAEHHLDGLPSFPVTDKRNDPRYAWYTKKYGPKCWELDALSPPRLRECVEDYVLHFLDGDAWDRMEEIEQAERESLNVYMRGLPSILGQATK